MIAQLNTIGVVRNKYYVAKIGKQVPSEDMRPQTSIDDNSTALFVSSAMSVIQPIYPQTTVSVVNADCLHVYGELATEGYQPVLLNITDARNPYKYGRICKTISDQDQYRCFSHPNVCTHETSRCITDTIHHRAFVHR